MIKKNMHNISKLIFLALLAVPGVASAQGSVFDIIKLFQRLLEMIVPLLIGLALVAVLWGLTRYAFKAGDENAQDEGRRVMVWGVITLFVMVSIWGFVAILQYTVFGKGTNVVRPPDVGDFPTLPTEPASGGNSDDTGDPGDSTL